MKNKLFLTLLVLIVGYTCKAQYSNAGTSRALVSNKTIASYTTVEYTHNKEIVLTDGFHAESGSDFHAYITDDETEYQTSSDRSTLDYSESKDLSLYPNPCADKFSVKFDPTKSSIKQLSLFDITGNQVLTLNYPHTNDINVSSLTKGLYIVEVVDNSNCVHHLKLIKN